MLRIGSRGSNLALVQSAWVRRQILQSFPDERIEIQIIRTSADRDTKTSIRSSQATGVFVREIEDALLGREIDLAVHSMKDLPTRLPESLEIGAIPAREDPRDALISRRLVRSMSDLPQGSRVGTGSIRRQAQLLAVRPDLKILDIRGNVDTRLRKMDAGLYDAIILACAGLNRLGMQNRVSLPLELSVLLPAPGQGALALEIRKGDASIMRMIESLNHPPTAAAVLAERAFLRTLGGGCNSPVAVHACMENGRLNVEGMAATPDGSRILRHFLSQEGLSPEEAGMSLAYELLSLGAGQILGTPN